MVIIDLAALTWNGFKSCVYRTYCVGGEPTDEHQQYYDLASKWLWDSIEMVRPGVTTADIASVWPSAKEIWGYEEEDEAAANLWGHGLGLAQYDQPVISRIWSLDHPQEIQPGMVFALETQHGKLHEFGVRLEEMLTVTDTGIEDAVHLQESRDNPRRMSADRYRVRGLDDPTAADVAVSGAKGAGLARARAAGFPVLDGFVIPPACSEEALGRALEVLESRGTGGSRMAIIGYRLPDSLVDQIESFAAALQPPFIVRSSSVLEGSGEWSGAFTSVPEVLPGEIGQAAKSVWATSFAIEVLERFEAAELAPGSAPMGVLVQPEVQPDFGGAAIVDSSGAVTVNRGEGVAAGLDGGMGARGPGCGRGGRPPGSRVR